MQHEPKTLITAWFSMAFARGATDSSAARRQVTGKVRRRNYTVGFTRHIHSFQLGCKTLDRWPAACDRRLLQCCFRPWPLKFTLGSCVSELSFNPTKVLPKAYIAEELGHIRCKPRGRRVKAKQRSRRHQKVTTTNSRVWHVSTDDRKHLERHPPSTPCPDSGTMT